MQRTNVTKRNAFTAAMTFIVIAICAVALKACSGYFADDMLEYAQSKRSIRMTNIALFFGANPCLENEYHVSILARAAWNGEVEIVKILLVHGANPDIRNYQGESSINGVKDKRIIILLHQAMQEGKK